MYKTLLTKKNQLSRFDFGKLHWFDSCCFLLFPSLPRNGCLAHLHRSFRSVSCFRLRRLRGRETKVREEHLLIDRLTQGKQKPVSPQMLVSTHLKNMLVNLDHFFSLIGVNKKQLIVWNHLGINLQGMITYGKSSTQKCQMVGDMGQFPGGYVSATWGKKKSDTQGIFSLLVIQFF